MGRFLDLGLQAVVQVVMDLLAQLLIIQAVEIEFFVLVVGHRRAPKAFFASRALNLHADGTGSRWYGLPG